MTQYEVAVRVNGELFIHDIETVDIEYIKPLLYAYYEINDTYDTLIIDSIRRYRYISCPYCKGTGEIEPCCKGNTENIYCACHGEFQKCDQCQNGKIKNYIED